VNLKAPLAVVNNYYDPSTNTYSALGTTTTYIRDNNIFMAKVLNGALVAWYSVSPNTRLATEVTALKATAGIGLLARNFAFNYYTALDSTKTLYARVNTINASETIYVSPTGSDKNEGFSSVTALLTIDEAIRRANRLTTKAVNIIIVGSSASSKVTYSGVVSYVPIKINANTGIGYISATGAFTGESIYFYGLDINTTGSSVFSATGGVFRSAIPYYDVTNCNITMSVAGSVFSYQTSGSTLNLYSVTISTTATSFTLAENGFVVLGGTNAFPNLPKPSLSLGYVVRTSTSSLPKDNTNSVKTYFTQLQDEIGSGNEQKVISFKPTGEVCFVRQDSSILITLTGNGQTIAIPKGTSNIAFTNGGSGVGVLTLDLDATTTPRDGHTITLYSTKRFLFPQNSKIIINRNSVLQAQIVSDDASTDFIPAANDSYEYDYNVNGATVQPALILKYSAITGKYNLISRMF
jgi:hypothetical protein